MDKEELKKRTFNVALRVLRLVAALPKTIEGRAVGQQVTLQPYEVAALRSEVAPTDLAAVEPRTDN